MAAATFVMAFLPCLPLATRHPRRAGKRFARPSSGIGVSTVVPNLSSRPPVAMAQSANQAHPTASPAMTSVNQWTPRSILDIPTAAAIPAASPASAARVRGVRPRDMTKADRRVAGCGGDGVPAREGRPGEGRERIDGRACSLHPQFDQIGDHELPNHHREERATSNGSGSAAIREPHTTAIHDSNRRDPTHVSARRSVVERLVAWAAAQLATAVSTPSTPRERTTENKRPATTPPTTTQVEATVSASPVAVAGSKRARRKRRWRRCWSCRLGTR
jgi:hypothetical protein